MKRKFRFYCLLFVMIFITSIVLTGCSQKDQETETTTTRTPAGHEELKPVELSWYLYSQEPRDLREVESKVNEYLKDKINTTLKLYTIFPTDSFVTVTTAMSAANEPYDLCFTAMWLEFRSGAARNRWLPLNLVSNNLLELNAPKIVEVTGEEVLRAGQINGIQFAIPVLKEKALSYGMIFNKALVDKYKIDITTINKMTDLEPYFKLIKENEPDITPYGPYQDSTNAFGDKLVLFENVAADSGIPADVRYGDPSFKVINRFETPEYKESLEIAHRWYLAGYIDPDAASDASTYWQKYNEGLFFAMNSTLKPGDAEAWSTDRVQWVQTFLVPPYISTNTLGGSMNAVSMTSRNPERALMLLELLYKDAYLVNLVSYGIENKHYTKVSENIIQDLPSDVGYSINRWTIGNNFLQYLQQQEDPNKWKNLDQFNNDAVVYATMGFDFDVNPYRSEYASIKNVIAEMSASLEFGAIDPETNLPRFLERLRSAGVDVVIEAVQESLDTWLQGQR